MVQRFGVVLSGMVLALPAWAQDPEAVAGDDTVTLLVVGAGGLIALATLVTRFTKTDKDDQFVARLAGVFKSLKK